MIFRISILALALCSNAEVVAQSSQFSERIQAPNPNTSTPGNNFGAAIGSFGNFLVVGAPNENVEGASSRGAAYVFELVNERYVQRARLLASDGAANDHFGAAVAISGDRIVVGAPEDNHSAGSGAGSAYVYARNGDLWPQQQKLIAPDGATGDAFGYAVAISGTNVVAGSPFDNLEGSLVNAGSAHWFSLQANTWNYRQRIIDPSVLDNSHFGKSVSLVGSVLAVGAPDFNQQRGFVSILDLSGSVVEQDFYYTGENPQVGDQFGAAVAVSLERAVIGQPGTLLRTGENRSVVSIHRFQSNSRSLVPDIGATGDRFGAAVQIDGTRVLVGAPRVDFGACCEFGRVSELVETIIPFGIEWRLKEQLRAIDATAFDAFGSTVAFSAIGTVVGSPTSNAPGGVDDAGSVLHYVRPLFRNGFE